MSRNNSQVIVHVISIHQLGAPVNDGSSQRPSDERQTPDRHVCVLCVCGAHQAAAVQGHSIVPGFLCSVLTGVANFQHHAKHHNNTTPPLSVTSPPHYFQGNRALNTSSR